ncbi:MAG: hypothetical protein WCS88_02745 [Patescibacteria group bacterium]|jgi:hypothetical protein
MSEKEMEIMPQGGIEKQSEKERGLNNRILLKIIRHGEKTPEGALTDYGREKTRETVANDKKIIEGIQKVKVMGSNAGPKNEAGQARALETADIYANTLVNEEYSDPEIIKYESRARSILEVVGQNTQPPFNWGKEYKENLPENFSELSDEDKAIASAEANEKNLTKLMTMPEAEDYRQEISARYAMFINTYIKMIDRIENDQKIMYPVGAHGGQIELFLQKCLKRKTEDGDEIIGFKDSKELGGSFNPSEGFFIDITTDQNGEKKIEFNFDDPKRFEGEELSLDLDTMYELIDKYKEKYGSFYDKQND